MINIAKIDNPRDFILQYPANTTIGIASVRAMPVSFLEAFKRDDISTILPVILFKGIEYGGLDMGEYYKHYEMTKDRAKALYGDTKTLLEPVIYSNIDFWRLFNIRYANYIANRYGVLNTCLTCKAYSTIISCHLASLFNKKVILGEKYNKDKTRFRKEDKIKSILEDSDLKLADTFGIELISPMDKYTEVAEVDHLIGDVWYFLEKEPRCLFEANWFGADGKALIDRLSIAYLIDTYIHPIREVLIRELNNNPGIKEKDIEGIISSYLKSKELQTWQLEQTMS